jgi:hypothetical protein
LAAHLIRRPAASGRFNAASRAGFAIGGFFYFFILQK